MKISMLVGAAWLVLVAAVTPVAASGRLVVQVSGATTGGSVITTAGIDTTGANLIVIAVSSSQPVAAPTPTDSKSNTWTGLTARTVSGVTRIQIFYSAAPTVGAAHTFTITTSGGAPALTVMAFSGIASSPFDQENGGSTGGNTASQATGNITPGQNNELIVFGLAYGTTVSPVSVTGSAAIAAQCPTVGGQHFGNAGGYALQGTAASVGFSLALLSGSISDTAAAIASFKTAVTSAETSAVYIQ